MKRIIAFIIMSVMLVTLAGCASTQPTEAPTAAPTEPAPQPHTVPPEEQEPEVEWSSIDRTMALEDADNLYAEGSDFTSFALVGDEASAELRFRFTDEIAEMLREQDGDIAYYITMDGKKIGDAKLSSDCGEATLVGEFSYNKLCALADKIRGFE